MSKAIVTAMAIARCIVLFSTPLMDQGARFMRLIDKNGR